MSPDYQRERRHVCRATDRARHDNLAHRSYSRACRPHRTDSCNRLHTPCTTCTPSLASFAPGAREWKLEAELTAGYCEHWSIGAEGPFDSTQLEDSIFRRPVHTCIQDDLRAVVTGPFHSLPGQFTSISVELTSLFDKGSQITEYHGEAVSPTGEPIGYPPLHMHHIHIGRVFNGKQGYTPHWFETHGDYGVEPFGLQPGTKLAAGYCDVTARLPTYVDAQVNDVRFDHDVAMGSDGKDSTLPKEGSEPRGGTIEW